MALAHSPRIVTDGLVLCLDAANPKSYPGSGTSWTNLISLPNATLTNGPTYNSINGGTIVFDGVNDYAITSALTGSFASFTVNVWFYPTSIANYRNVIGCNVNPYTSGNIGPRLEMNSSGNLVWVYSNITGSNASYYTQEVVASGLQVNTWHCASITYNGATNSSVTFYNGISTNSLRVTTGSPTGFVGVINDVTVGWGFRITSDRYFAGRIPLAQIYNRALSAAEIAQNFNAIRGRYEI